MFISNLVSKVVGEKARWRQYKARAQQLPIGHRTALEALERYLMYVGLVDDPSKMFEDLVELFEQSAANATTVRETVGDDPVEFIETFVQNYPQGQWRIRERERLVSAIDGVVAAEVAASGVLFGRKPRAV